MSEPPEVDRLAVIEAKLDAVIQLLERIADTGDSAVGLLALLD